MSELQIPISHTQNLINYNTLISEKTTLSAYRSKRSVSGNSAEQSMQLKKFHEYFGKIKPSLYTELKNIFQNAHFDESSYSPQLDYHIQGTTLSSRAKKLRQSKQRKVNQSIDSNNLTIESFNKKQTVRRAKISKLLEYQKGLESELTEQVTRSILRKSDQLMHQLKDSLQGEKRTNYRSTGKSFRVSKSVADRQSFLQWINPDKKDRFTAADLNSALGVLHQIDIQLSPTISYFNVYIEEGNNSELLKNLVRKRNGWRVVELPVIANLIWTQFYRKGLLKKRLHKRQRSQNEEEKDKNLKMQTARKIKIPSLEKKPDIFRMDLTFPKNSENNFNSQIRKLVPLSESQSLATMKKPSLCNIQSIQVTHNVLLHNHFPFNCCISDKKNLLFHLNRYLSTRGQNVFDYVPESYEVNDLTHPIIHKFEEKQGEEKDYWIIKPGENSNRGRGITISRSKQQTLQELQKRLSQDSQTRQNISQIRSRKSIILQRYLKPLLYNGRKFDIRSYMLVTFLSGQLRMYCYEQCYIRTSSKVFDIDSGNRLVHLTNDAIQSHSSDYGKYEEGNKVSQQAFARFIDEQYQKKCPGKKIWNLLKTQMQERCIAVVESSQQILLKGINPSSNDNQNFYFQLFGMDFMLDDQFKLWLIQVNTNPAITHDCSRVLNNLIPRMLDNVFAIAVQPIMKPLRLHDIVYNNQFVAVYKKNIL